MPDNKHIEQDALNWIWNLETGFVFLETLYPELLTYLLDNLKPENREEFLKILFDKTIYSFLISKETIQNTQISEHLFYKEYLWQAIDESMLMGFVNEKVEDWWRKALFYEKKHNHAPVDIQENHYSLINLEMLFIKLFTLTKKDHSKQLLKERCLYLLGLSAIYIDQSICITKEIPLKYFSHFCHEILFKNFTQADLNDLSGMLVLRSNAQYGYYKTSKYFENVEWLKKMIEVEKEVKEFESLTQNQNMRKNSNNCITEIKIL